ncbi:hypothetical protein PPSIR1_08706 [Plesiocystis pacifica SIR-1]|uniref:Lipoprotein n=1 Tax=Plesiocystis pacifica SIR-1 TaxID=391625 RepID=A6G7B8_9BACT|nr:hypothetical protein [Plesiocystis pacifica]EDM78252.1 hypothetical protein PPSIR1_08706 [Plesiocystis pacifica SIR-1]
MSRRAWSSLVFAACVALAGASSLTGCRTTQAYVDWRPGLSAADFDGIYEISRADYQGYADAAEPNTYYDRFRGESHEQFGAAVAELDARLTSERASPDTRGYAVMGLSPDAVTLLEAGGEPRQAPIDWFAVTGDRDKALLVSGSKVMAVVGGASTGIDAGGVLGPGQGNYRFMLLDNEGELTLFALPELGGAITANEPGWVFAFVPTPGGKKAWDISVGRVTVAL